MRAPTVKCIYVSFLWFYILFCSLVQIIENSIDKARKFKSDFRTFAIQCSPVLPFAILLY